MSKAKSNLENFLFLIAVKTILKIVPIQVKSHLSLLGVKIYTNFISPMSWNFYIGNILIRFGSTILNRSSLFIKISILEFFVKKMHNSITINSFISNWLSHQSNSINQKLLLEHYLKVELLLTSFLIFYNQNHYVLKDYAL